MKADLYVKLSKYALYASSAVILIVFIMFFCVGERLVLEMTSEGTGEVTELQYPRFTELSLYLCYIMFFVVLLLVLVFESVAAIKSMMYSTKGLAKKIAYAVGIIGATVALYFISPKGEYQYVDFLIYLQYVLFGITALLMIGSMFISKMRS